MRWLVLVAVVIVGGCATEVGPTQAELRAQWEAQNVFPQNYKNDLMAYMRTYLNDPSNIRGASVSPPVRKTAGPAERYVVCLRYNARKGGGQYAGPKESAAIFVSGKLDRFLDVPTEVREFCKDAAYAPFPELEALTR